MEVPPPPSQTMLNFGEMGGNESVWGSQHCQGEWRDKGMNPKPIQTFSLGAESYVTIITRKVFSPYTHVLLNSTVAVNMVHTTLDKQILRTFHGFFKDKLQFSRTKIYLINRHFLTSFDHPIGQNTSWSHF